MREQRNRVVHKVSGKSGMWLILLCHISNTCEIERSLILSYVRKIGIRILVKGVKLSGLVNKGGKTNHIIV
jgi:hypothetical protein